MKTTKVEVTRFGCDLCNYTSMSERNTLWHEIDKHNPIEKKHISGVGNCYYFKDEFTFELFKDYYDTCDGTWLGEDWYSHEFTNGWVLSPVNQVLEHMINERKQLTDKINNIKDTFGLSDI